MSGFGSAVERACNTEPGSEDSRKSACDEIVIAINEKKLSLLDLAVALAGPLTSPEKEAREHGTRLLGEVVTRCRGELGLGELHTLAEFLSARLRDWPCVGAAAAACRALLQPLPSASAVPLREDSALLILEATAEMLRTAQSFRQDDRSALLALLTAAARGWGGVAAARGVPLLDSFLGAADGEKDPRCLLAAFEAVRALCDMHHAPGADPTPLRQLADELADWTSAYFPIAFNPPPPPPHRGPGPPPVAITRAMLAEGLEGAMRASPFLAAGVLPLLLEKLGSTYRPAKEDALSALRACCPAYGPDALAPHAGQLWTALRSEVLAPCSSSGTGAAAAAAAGPDADEAVSLAAAAARCVTVVLRAAGPGSVITNALQDASLSDLLLLVRGPGGGSQPTHGSFASPASEAAAARADRRVLCGATLLAAVCASGPAALQAAQPALLAPLQSALTEALVAPDTCDRYDQTLHGLTVLTTVLEAVAAELDNGDGSGGGLGAASWLGSSPAAGGAVAVLNELRRSLMDALARVHDRLTSGADGTITGGADGDVSMGDAVGAAAVGYSPAAAAQLRTAVVAGWRALLRLHTAAATTAAAAAGGTVAAAAAQLLLGQADAAAAAAEQLCTCALQGAGGAADAPASPVACRMRWGKPVDASAEAAAALQHLLALPTAPTAVADTTASSADGEATGSVGAASVVPLLISRLAAAMAPGGGSDGRGAVKAAALRLAARLAAPEAPSSASGEAASAAVAAGPSIGDGSGAFAAAWLDSLPPLLFGLRGVAAEDEEWLRDCLKLLATTVLPTAARRPPADPAAAATAAAAHRLAAAALAAAAEWEAGGAVGLPFRAAGAPGADTPSSRSASSAGHPSLAECWCGAVQQLVACCDVKQQLALALEAAERIATSAVAAAPAAGTTPPSLPSASLPLACAVVCGLRPPLLAPSSTAALADSLLHLLAAAPPTAATAAAPSGPASACRDGGLQAAVALAAAVNRWQDAAALDAWLESAFRPALLQRLAGTADSSCDAAAAAAIARAVGWVGRALALRNHPALKDVVSALLGCLLYVAGSSGDGSAGGGTADMEVDGEGAGPSPALPSQAQSSSEAAAMAAAEAFGLLVADEAAAGGVSLPAAPAAAVCRVLWQQRSYSLCAQALSEVASGLQSGSQPVPLPLAVAVARLAGAAPGQLCGQDAPRLAPLLLRSTLRLSRTLGGPEPGLGTTRGSAPPAAPLTPPAQGGPSGAQSPSAASAQAASEGPSEAAPAAEAAAAALSALRGALDVLLGWLQEQNPAPEKQSALGKVLQDHVTELVDCLCSAAAVGAAPPAAARLSIQQPAQAAAAAAPPRPPLPAAAAAGVREAALRSCCALMDSLPYHLLHPLRSQVLAAIVAALDDNRRSVRQLAVRARRVWGDK